MSDSPPKVYQICSANGVWRQLPEGATDDHPAELLSADHDHRFFLMDCFLANQNAAGEESTPDQPNIICVSSDHPDMPELDPQREWTRENSASYRAPAKVARVKLEYDILDRLAGIWDTARVGSMEDEFVIFLPDGLGVIEYWRPELAAIDEFRWQMIAGERLLIEPVGLTEANDRRHGPFQFFGAAQLKTSIFEVTDAYGEKFDMLEITPLANPDRLLQLRRSKRLLGEYRIPRLA